MLPETLNKNLPDTVQDADHLSSGGDEGNQFDDISSGVRVGVVDDGTLVRGQNGTLMRIHSPMAEETNYGKSPEWVEVDGLIVSKNHLPRGSPNARGSVISLPYSNRTTVSNYNSSTLSSSIHQRSSSQDETSLEPTKAQTLKARQSKVEVENDYESIPANVNIKDRNLSLPFKLMDSHDESVTSAHHSAIFNINSGHHHHHISNTFRKKLLMDDTNETIL